MVETNSDKKGSGGLFLVGFMGCGKTTVGRILADRLSRPFLDLDQVIVDVVGKEIPNIFQEEGEPAFRRYERDLVKTLPINAVIALGGGAFIQDEIRAYTRHAGKAIFLDWPFQVLFSRVAGDESRPLAKNASAMRSLFEKRKPVYQKAGIVWSSVAPHDETPEEIADQLLNLLA